jgi:hypothetical protein
MYWQLSEAVLKVRMMSWPFLLELPETNRWHPNWSDVSLAIGEHIILDYFSFMTINGAVNWGYKN